MTARLAAIHRYPLKGLTVEVLDEASLAPGRGLPGDRRFALAHGGAAGAGAGAKADWQPKTRFVTLVDCPRLAGLRTRFDAEAGELTIYRDGRRVARGRVGDPVGRAMIEEFFKAYLGDAVRGTPRLVEARRAPFTDVRGGYLSLINLASVADLERVVGKPVNPLRFRANLLIEGLPPWREFAWTGRRIAVGGAVLRVIEPIERCEATNVDPGSAARDMNIPRALAKGFDHVDFGVLAEVVAEATIRPGDPVGPVGGEDGEDAD